MNRFERISETEYNKTVAEEFKIKNGVLNHLRYSEIKIPRRATKGSAGYDFYSPISFKLRAGETIKVPTCIKCSLNPHNVLMLFPRSSLGFKYRMQLDNSVGVVDQDYYNNASNEGHIFIKVTNDSKSGQTLEIKAGEAFAQGIIMRYEVTDDDNVEDIRIGGIGSTTERKK